ncbi:MAG TPA: type II toxin-antitoxin system Phd/YefM family antitoxin [Streptosporangiaceae bacterium]|nr:type II toxin-antitoxin system Phd/YefM family antitoxin [Terriglobales bacterium]HUZ35699.1 type II toxin-antitoxin system Phd/YefM family antitoxin [Streptosporangiaceae bacterium]
MKPSPPSQRAVRHSWTVAEAKAKLSELIAHADAHGLQVITRHGRPTAFVVSPEAWSAQAGRAPRTLAQLLAPLRGLGPLPEREKQPWSEPRL